MNDKKKNIRQEKVQNDSRRGFLKKATFAAGAISLGALVDSCNSDKSPEKGKKLISKLSELKPNEPVSFSFPENEPAYIIDFGKQVVNGVGANKSIVAFSALCQHMGCPVGYDKDNIHFVCPCHASVFEPLKGGAVLEGPSLAGLPKITLAIENENIYATGIADGIVYGRACNTVI